MKYFFNILFILLVFSCSIEQKEEVIADENFDPILTPYFSYVNALGQNDFEKAREVGEQLRDSEANTGVERAFKSMGRLISGSSSLYDQRTILEQMAIVVQLHIEQHLINDYSIFKFRCKNKFDDKEVFWYSLSKKTVNPFIGENSTDCVELIETIKPVIKQ